MPAAAAAAAQQQCCSAAHASGTANLAATCSVCRGSVFQTFRHHVEQTCWLEHPRRLFQLATTSRGSALGMQDCQLRQGVKNSMAESARCNSWSGRRGPSASHAAQEVPGLHSCGIRAGTCHQRSKFVRPKMDLAMSILVQRRVQNKLKLYLDDRLPFAAISGWSRHQPGAKWAACPGLLGLSTHDTRWRG